MTRATIFSAAKRSIRSARTALLVLVLVACTSTPKSDAPPAQPASASTARSGGYYKDDGPGDHPPANLDAVPDAIPRLEPLNRFANRPYTVFGRDYVPATTLREYKERGVASWYGRKFHGQKTADGETYDMYAMTAAHPTLPLPSYARVTNVANGKSVIVRVNDRGPFHPGRVIDLSYVAAFRLGIAQRGSGEVEVESVLPSDAPIVASAQLPPLLPPIAASPETAALPIGQDSGGYVVQLGAFANYANAQEFSERVANQSIEPRVEPKVRQIDTLFRVYVGPYPTQDAANAAASALRHGLGLDVAVKPK